MLVVVTGPRGGEVNPQLREYTIVAVKFFAKKLGILDTPVRLHVKLHKKTYMDSVDGHTAQNNKRKYTIEVCIYNDWLTTLAHEMVHVKQFINGELTHEMIDDALSHEDYKNTPHEMEAANLQNKLVSEYTERMYTLYTN